jgi:hypothetical protein
MLSLYQYQILNSCCDDLEIFYFPFAEINFGGQLFHRSQGNDYAQYVEDAEWPTRIPAATIISDLVALVNDGFLDCWRVDDDHREKVQLTRVENGEFAIYLSYECKTYEDHLSQYDYGPHEFYITEPGRREMHKPEYRQYDRELGWNA